MSHDFYYSGFKSPNTTQVPDELFDVLLPELSDAELRVLLYIIRRTFGFKKEADNISLRQMVEGITTRDGRVLDRGVGVSKATVSRALQGLQVKGIIVAQRNRSAERGNEPTTYAVRFADREQLDQETNKLSTPIITSETRGVSPARQALSSPADPQHTELQETVIQHTDPYSNGFEGEKSQQRDRETSFSKKRKLAKNQFESTEDRSAQRERRDAPAPIAQVLADRFSTRPLEAVSEPRGGPRSDFSSGNGTESQPTAKRGRPPKATEQITALVDQFSGEFHDEEHTKPNISHAARLWKASGLSEDAFCQRLYEARARTKQAPGIEKRASGEAGKYGARNKMPYFFACLEDVLGMKDDQAGRSSTTSP